MIPVLKALAWWYIGRFVKKSDVMTAPSLHACETIREHFPKIPVEHIRNGVDLQEFRERNSCSDLIEKYPEFNNKSFIFVGRLGEEKSVSVLIEAFRIAYNKDNDLRLFLIGDGPGRKEYEKKVNAWELNDSVFFLGRIDHRELITCGLYHHTRALVTASTTENQPVTVLEAIGCNAPVIIPDVAGINELLSDNGLSFKAADAEDFARQMLKLANDEELYKRCKNGGLKLKNKFDGMEIAKQFEELYENISDATGSHSNQRA
jgi:glycosyltransferase involved in cell wall biosynthesis